MWFFLSKFFLPLHFFQAYQDKYGLTTTCVVVYLCIICKFYVIVQAINEYINWYRPQHKPLGHITGD